MAYISSVAVLLTWSHDELTSHVADPLLASAVTTLRRRMTSHLLKATSFPRPIDEALRADTDAAVNTIELCKVSVGGEHHLRVAIAAEIQHRKMLLGRGIYR